MKEKEEFEIKIKFASHEAAKHFMSAFDGQGEQVYWEWMEAREQESSENITAVKFVYDYQNLEIDTKLGRLND